MSLPPKSRRNSEAYDDYEDEDPMDVSFNRIGAQDTKQFLFDILARWHWIALCLVIGILGGFYYLSKAPKLYQANASLLINQQTSTVLVPDQVEKMDMRTLEAMNTVAERITRKELLERVAARPELRSMPGLIPKGVVWFPTWTLPWLGISQANTTESAGAPSVGVLAGSISSWINVSVRKGTRILDIVITHPSPDVAKAVADAVCTEYKAELGTDKRSDRSEDLKVLQTESEAARTRLQTAQNALAIYQRALLTLKDLESREALVADLSRRYLGKHPKMVSANSDLKSYQVRFLSEFDAARNSTADREYWNSNAAEWNKISGDESEKLMVARRLLIARGTVLESEILSQNAVFNNLLTSSQRAVINQQSEATAMEINSSAQLPDAPSSPVRLKVIAVASFGGMSVGILIALGLIRLDNKIHTVSQAERETGLPALAAVAKISPSVLADVLKKYKEDTNQSEARQKWSPMLLFRDGVSTTTFAEMFRVLRASVSLLGDEKKRRITLFTSALPGEGKSFVASNFALAAAQQGKRILLMDLDLRKPSVHKVFGLKRDCHPSGASEVLAGLARFEEGIFTDTGEERLHIMLAGKRAPAPGELLNSTSLEALFIKALEHYDLIIVDSAPLLAVPDTRIIAPLVDNFCLVTRADYVPKGALRRVIRLLENDQVMPNGIVFNSFSEKRRLMGQNYSYGNYQTNKYGKAYRYGYGSYGVYGSDSDD
jgi:polysaccharide biosynthesis transport protein